ncbi:MAG: hypothetical protein NZ889_01100 [Candidatus Pacearchaeota archaeon]|nr:hypothetical protein [Candidatus Pacearchaeota archaeon]
MRKKVSEEIKQKIEFLLKKAEEVSKKNPEEARRLIKKARNIAKHNNYRIPKEWRSKFCRKCNSFFDGKNIKIRISKGKISTCCLECSNITRKKFKTS